MKRMSLAKFGQLVADVVAALPPQLHQYLDNVLIDVADEADDAMLRDLGFTAEEIAVGDTVYGYFEPMPIGAPDGVNFLDEPHRIWVFKRPLEEDFPNPVELREEIRITVLHEIGHHFGWSERDMEAYGLD